MMIPRFLFLLYFEIFSLTLHSQMRDTIFCNGNFPLKSSVIGNKLDETSFYFMKYVKKNEGEFLLADNRVKNVITPDFYNYIQNCPMTKGIPTGDSLVYMPYPKSKREFKEFVNLGLSNDIKGRVDYTFYTQETKEKTDTFFHKNNCNTLKRYFIQPNYYDSVDISLNGIRYYSIEFIALFDNNGSFRKILIGEVEIDTLKLTEKTIFEQLSCNEHSDSIRVFKLNCLNSINSYDLNYAISSDQRIKFSKNRYEYDVYQGDLSRFLHWFGTESFYNSSIDKYPIYKDASIYNIEDFFVDYQKKEEEFKKLAPDFLNQLNRNFKKIVSPPVHISEYEIYSYLKKTNKAIALSKINDPNYYFGYFIKFKITKTPALSYTDVSRKFYDNEKIINNYIFNMGTPNNLNYLR